MKKYIIIIILIFIVTVSIIYACNNKKMYSKYTLEPEYNNEVYKKAVELNGGNKEDLLNNQQEYYSNLKEQTMDKVSIKIKENTLSKTGATIIITDENKIPYSLEQDDYTLEKNIFGNLWVGLPLKSGYYIEPFCGHGENGITEMKIDWTERYGELKKGKYRIVIVENKLYAEFNII